ncbi:MAG: hypothetical protein K6B14_02025 [Lachnospiraceae bacterium]|nr:hypothetical protein [Lachnospiraceae bacterium]
MDRYSISKTKYFVMLLAAVAVGMFIYELACCREFIAYMDGYYTYKYLPDFIIDHNFDYYVKFPMGTSMCELPFFLVAHVITLIMDPLHATGFGGAYETAIGVCGIFYFCLGFSFLYATLKKVFGGSAAFLTCLCLMLGTPLILYGSKYAAFSHIYTFAVSAILLYLSKIIDSSHFEKAISLVMGICVGLLFLIRNVNVFFVLIYVLMYAAIRGEYGEHFKKLFSPNRLPYNAVGALMTILPQLYHWHRILGSWLPNTYSDESFIYAASPKMYDVWFSDAKGYFIFAPVMILSVLGFFFLPRTDGKKYMAASALLFVFESYMTAAWWCWWMGGVYSIRSFLDITVFMAIPMCGFFVWYLKMVSKRGMAVLIPGIITVAIFFYINFALLRGAEKGIINETLSSWWQIRQSLLLR